MTYYEHHVLMTLRLGRWAETGSLGTASTKVERC